MGVEVAVSWSTFAQVRADLAARADLDVSAGGPDEAIVLRRGRGRVAVLTPGMAVPDADVFVCVGEPSALLAGLSEAAAVRVHVLPLPVSEPALARVLASALAAAQAFARSQLVETLLDIGLALNAERDPARLLELILWHARAITGADAGSIYVVEGEGDTLRFAIAHNDSVAADFTEFTMAVSERSIVGAAVLSGKAIRIPDLYVEGGPMALGRVFQHDRSFDTRFGYQTRSMITTPMIAPGGKVLAVIQLINAKHDPGPLRSAEDFSQRVRPFSDDDERLASALAAQAAVALENARLYREIQALFEGFVRASVHAIEQRDPTTSGHSQRVADLSVALARAADQVGSGPFAAVRFSPEDLREIEYAGLLHDFGKVGVREQVLVKAKKLYPHQLELLMARFDHARTLLQVELVTEQLSRRRAGEPEDPDLAAATATRQRRIDEMLSIVLAANEPTVLAEAVSDRLHDVARELYVDLRGAPVPLLLPGELDALLVRRGSLTEAERVEIQHHVTHTYNFLVRIPWGPALRGVPDIAGKHHEYLDGSGYPTAAPAEAIPLQARMMTVADIYDALTAADRPYKRAISCERALDILRAEVSAGKVDGDVLDLFVGARIWQQHSGGAA